MGRGRGYGPGSSEGAGGARRSKPQDQASSARNLGAKSAGPPHPTGQLATSNGGRPSEQRARQPRRAGRVPPRSGVYRRAPPPSGRERATAGRFQRVADLRACFEAVVQDGSLEVLASLAYSCPARAHLRWCARAAPADFGTV